MQELVSSQLLPFESLGSRYTSDIPHDWTSMLRTRLRESSVPLWHERVEQWRHYGLADLGVSVSAKAVMLHRIAGRIDGSFKRLRAELRANEPQIRSLVESGRAYRVAEDSVDIDILIDIDAFIFEAHSFLELLVDFMRIFYSNFLLEQFPARTVRNLPEAFTSDDVDGTWIATLEKTRSIFIHDEAPWLALNLGGGEIDRWEVVMLRGKLVDNSGDQESFDHGEFRAIYNGMTAGVNEIIEGLAEKLSAAEERLTERR
jgi:hypothetical protein